MHLLFVDHINHVQIGKRNFAKYFVGKNLRSTYWLKTFVILQASVPCVSFYAVGQFQTGTFDRYDQWVYYNRVY